MNYYLTRALDAPEKGMTRAEIFKKNDGDYGIFLNKPKLVQNERVQGGYDNDTTFVAGNSKHAQKISSHCTEDWENFTDFKLKGEVCKKIKKMVPILGGRTRYIVRGKDKDRDIVFILMRSDTKRKAPDHAYTMRNGWCPGFNEMYEFSYDEWLKFTKLPIGENTAVAIKGIKFLFCK